MSDPLSAKDVIERFCKLQAEVYQALSNAGSADCFCGGGGYWGAKGYDGTFEGGYRNDGEALAFIERATRAAIANLSSNVSSTKEQP